MALLDTVQRWLRRTGDDAPSMAITVALPASDSADMIVTPGAPPLTREATIGHDVWGIALGVSYRDGDGQGSTRRIRLRNLYHAPGSDILIEAHCYDRGAVRGFLASRIETIHGIDGSARPDARAFFRDSLGIDLDAATRATALTADGDLLPEFRHGMRLLAAFAHADGALHDDEVRIILSWLRAAIARAKLDLPVSDAALTERLRALRPARDELAAALAWFEARPAEKAEIGYQARRIVEIAGLTAAERTLFDEAFPPADERLWQSSTAI